MTDINDIQEFADMAGFVPSPEEYGPSYYSIDSFADILSFARNVYERGLQDGIHHGCNPDGPHALEGPNKLGWIDDEGEDHIDDDPEIPDD